MAFITSGTTVLSFATYDDVVDRDQRVFEANEGLTVDVVEDLLIRSTDAFFPNYAQQIGGVLTT